LAGEGSITVVTVVVGVSDGHVRPRARAYFRLAQLALEHHAITIGVSDENIEARSAGLIEKTNLELELSRRCAGFDERLALFCFDAAKEIEPVGRYEIPEYRLRQSLRTGHAAKPPVTISPRKSLHQPR
jgi:hypothetical protein